MAPGLPPHTFEASPSDWPPGTQMASSSESQVSKAGRVPPPSGIESWPHPDAPVSCSPAPHPNRAREPCLPAMLPRWAPHLSLELLADSGVLADVTVQADHIALQLRRGHREDVCLFIQSSFKPPLQKAGHDARLLTHSRDSTHNQGNRLGKVSALPETTAGGRGCP